MDPLVPHSCLELITTNILQANNIANILPDILIIIALIFASAFFSATETALLYCNRQRMKVQAEAGSKTSKLVLKILEKSDKSIVTILIGNNIVNILASSIAAVVSILIISNNGLATLLSTVVMTIVVLLFGELIPKNFAQIHPEKLSQIVSIPIYFLMLIFTPISIIFIGLIHLIKKVLKITDDEEKITEDDFHGIVDTITDEGVLDEEESDIINNAVEFGDKTVKDVMTSLENVEALDSKYCTRSGILNFLNETDYSRIPIYTNTKDNIIGILLTRSYLKKAMMNSNFSFKSCMLEPLKVSSSMKIDLLVDFFKEKKNHLALVINKDEQVIGLVTMEDALEELIGESEETILPEDGDNNE